MDVLAVDSLLGPLTLSFEADRLCQLQFGKAAAINLTYCARTTAFLTQLQAYWDLGTPFGMATAFSASPFTQRVLRAIQTIPCGETITYGELASALGTGPRAVANACRRNPVPLIIPCHRVVGRSTLGGYLGARSGPMCTLKATLLNREREIIA